MDAAEFAFWTESTQTRIEHEQRRARARFEQIRRTAELTIREETQAWASSHATEAGVLRADASLPDLSRRVKQRLDSMLQDLTGSGEWPPRKGGRPETLQGTAVSIVKAVESWKDKLGLEGPSAGEYLASGRAEAVWQDHKANPVGVREREARQLVESAARLRASGASVEDVSRMAGEWQIHPGIYQLSTDAHALAYARSYLGEIGDANRSKSWLPYVSESVAPTLNPSGRTASVAYRVLTETQLANLYRTVNAGRRTATTPRTLGLGHGTREVYYPIPESIEEEVRGWYAESRRRFESGFETTVRTSTREDVASMVRRTREEIRGALRSSEVSPAEGALILGRLTTLLDSILGSTV